MTAEPETNAARLIVCERDGHWAVALRRELAGLGVRVWETRTADDCRRELADSPASFVVLQMARNPVDTLHILDYLVREYPAARFVVVVERLQAAFEWPAREAGAVHFLCSPRRLGPLARMACRHLAQVPPPQKNMAERIWASLPWNEKLDGRKTL